MDRRAFPRLNAEIEAHVAIGDAAPVVGACVQLSAEGMLLRCAAPSAVGDRVMVDLVGGAQLEGLVVRQTDDGFALRLEYVAPPTMARLRDVVADLIARGRKLYALNLDNRTADRVTGLAVETRLETQKGPVACRIIDMSKSGAALETDTELLLGAVVTIGAAHARVIRAEGNRYGVEFLPERPGRPGIFSFWGLGGPPPATVDRESDDDEADDGGDAAFDEDDDGDRRGFGFGPFRNRRNG